MDDLPHAGEAFDKDYSYFHGADNSAIAIMALQGVGRKHALVVPALSQRSSTVAQHFDAYMRKPINLDTFCNTAVILAHR